MTNALVKVRKNQNECGSRVKKQVLPTYFFLLLSINCCSYRFMLSCNENPWLMQFADIYDIGVRRYVINNSSVINRIPLLFILKVDQIYVFVFLTKIGARNRK